MRTIIYGLWRRGRALDDCTTVQWEATQLPYHEKNYLYFIVERQDLPCSKLLNVILSSKRIVV